MKLKLLTVFVIVSFRSLTIHIFGDIQSVSLTEKQKWRLELSNVAHCCQFFDFCIDSYNFVGFLEKTTN